MPRVVGIDPGTISVDLCGLHDGHLFLDRTIPTADALADPSVLLTILRECGPLDLVAGPSGYGLPLLAANDLTERDIRLACLAAEGDVGGVGGLGALLRAFAQSTIPVVLTPGVIHLPSVPTFRKVNRVDMGTADKVCATALALVEHSRRTGCPLRESSFILLELGGAFSAAVAVCDGRIVDGLGGTSGPLGMEAAGALDGEVAFLSGTVTKSALFSGGVRTIAGCPAAAIDEIANTGEQGQIAWAAYIESSAKAIAALRITVPNLHDVVLSGRVAQSVPVREALRQRLTAIAPLELHVLTGFARHAKHAAQGAALIADGLAGGSSAPIVESLEIRRATGTVVDHLYVISRATAGTRLRLP